MAQPAAQGFWLIPICILPSTYALHFTGHLESLVNAVFIFSTVFICTYMAANALFSPRPDVTVPSDPTPAEAVPDHAQELRTRLERVEAWRQTTTLSFSSSEKETEGTKVPAKPTKEERKKDKKDLRKRLGAFIKPDRTGGLGARRPSEEEVVFTGRNGVYAVSS